MKIRNFQAFFFLCCITLNAPLATALAQNPSKQQLAIPLSEPGQPFTLNVDIISGSIQVTTYGGKEVIIDAVGEENVKSESETKNGMRRIGGRGLELNVEEKNNVVRVREGFPNRLSRLTIRIPMATARLKLSTINEGSITVSNVKGELEISDLNGAIVLNAISGSVVANTINGDITVKFKALNEHAPMAFSTLNGNVDVSFPANIRASFKLKSDQGEIYTDFDLVSEVRRSKVVTSTKAGMYQVKLDDWVYGRVGGGGQQVLMKNMNGNIYIRRVK